MDHDDVLDVLGASKDLLTVVDLDLKIVFASEGYRSVLGYDPASMIGRNALELLHPDEVEVFVEVVGQVGAGKAAADAPTLYQVLHADGRYVTLDAFGGVHARDGSVVGFSMVARPPRRSEVYAQVLHSLLDEQPLAVSFESVPSAMFPMAAAKVCFTCWPESEPMFSVGDRLPPRLSGRHRPTGTPWDRAVRSGEVVSCSTRADMDPETAALCTDDAFASVLVMPVRAFGPAVVGLWTIWTGAGMPPAEGLAGLGRLVCDLSEAALRIRERFDDLHRSARSDALTGLANRVAFDEALHACADASSVAILYIDLDRFKAVNDTYGHGVGDALLEAVARRMAGEVREPDVIARLGGDEFAVLCPGCDRGEAEGIAQRIVDSVSQPIVIDGREVAVGASVGVAYSAVYANDLLRRADDALYVAKSAGRGRVQVSDDDGT